MDNKDCCCFCFSARTGVMIIGAFLWIGLFFYCIDFALGYPTQPEVTGVTPWQYLVGGICNLILAIKFCHVVSNEHKPRDFAIRKAFARAMLIIGVFVNGALSIFAMIAAILTFKSQCES